MHFRMLSVIAISLAMLYSCTDVDYGYIDYGTGTGTSGQTNVLFSFGLDESSEQGPEAYYIAMSRIVNEVHYTYVVGRQGDQLVEEGLPDADDSSADNGNEEAGRVPVAVLDGDYYAIAFGKDDKGYRITDYGGSEIFGDFEKDNSLGMKNLYASLPVSAIEDVSQQYGFSLVDFNPSFKIVSGASPLYLSIKKATLNSGSNPTEIVFEPKDRTINLRFRVNLDVDETVEIKQLLAEISGVPSKVQLMSGIITEDNLGKVYFEMKPVDHAAGNVQTYEGQVRVLGLFASRYSSYMSGAGILRLYVLASAGDGESAVERRFYAGINLKNIIENGRLMLRTEDGMGYRAAKSEAVLDVPAKLVVKKDQVVSGGGDALEEWMTGDDIDAEV